MDSKPPPLKIGMTDSRFIKIAITCIVIAIVVWVTLFHYYSEPSMDEPPAGSIEE